MREQIIPSPEGMRERSRHSLRGNGDCWLFCSPDFSGDYA